MEWAGAWQIGNVTATFLSAPLDPFVHVLIHVHVHVRIYTRTANIHDYTSVSISARTHIQGYIYLHINTQILTFIIANHKFNGGRKKKCTRSTRKTMCVLPTPRLKLLL